MPKRVFVRQSEGFPDGHVHANEVAENLCQHGGTVELGVYEFVGVASVTTKSEVTLPKGMRRGRGVAIT